MAERLRGALDWLDGHFGGRRFGVAALALVFVVGALVASGAWWIAELIATYVAPPPDAVVAAPTAKPTPAALALPAVLAMRDAHGRGEAALRYAGPASAEQLGRDLTTLGSRADPGAEQVRTLLLARLAALDPARAMAMLEELRGPLGARRGELVRVVFAQWGSSRFETARAELTLLPLADRLDAAAALLPLALANRIDPEVFLRDLPEDTPRGELRAQAFRLRALANPETAWQAARALQDDDALLEVAGVWAARDGAAAYAVTEELEAQALRQRVREQVYRQWLRRAPDAALEHMLGQWDTAGDADSARVFALVGSATGARYLDTIVDRVSRADHEKVVGPLLEGLVSSDPEEAWKVLRGAVLAPETKQPLRLAILQHIAAFDPDRAIALTSSLSETRDRDRLLRALAGQFERGAPATAMLFVMEIDNVGLREQLRIRLSRGEPLAEPEQEAEEEAEERPRERRRRRER